LLKINFALEATRPNPLEPPPAMMSLWCQWQLEMYICVHGWLRNQYASVIKFWVEKWTCTHSSCCSSCPCVSVLCWPAIARSESCWTKTQSDSSPETDIHLHLDEPAHRHTRISTQIQTYIHTYCCIIQPRSFP